MTPHPARHTVTGTPTRAAAHAARPAMRPVRLLRFTAAGLGAVALIGLGVWAYGTSDGPAASTPPSAQLITVSPSGHP